jgi:hypothetical protein
MKKMNGGSGAADFATAVYGGPGQQHAGENGNVIAMKPGVVGQCGGRRRRSRRGGMAKSMTGVSLGGKRRKHRRSGSSKKKKGGKKTRRHGRR